MFGSGGVEGVDRVWDLPILWKKMVFRVVGGWLGPRYGRVVLVSYALLSVRSRICITCSMDTCTS